MKVKREHVIWDGSTVSRTDEAIIEKYLTPLYSSSSGQVEQLQDELFILRRLIAELLLQLHGQAVVDLCEDKE